MESSIEKILEATLKSDPSITPAKRNAILRFARNVKAAEPMASERTSRIYSREQAAEMIGGRTTRYVDQLCRKGLLQKLTPRGNRRAIGVTSASLESFIAGT